MSNSTLLVTMATCMIYVKNDFISIVIVIITTNTPLLLADAPHNDTLKCPIMKNELLIIVRPISSPWMIFRCNTSFLDSLNSFFSNKLYGKMYYHSYYLMNINVIKWISRNHVENSQSLHKSFDNFKIQFLNRNWFRIEIKIGKNF